MVGELSLRVWLGYGLALTSVPAAVVTTVPNLLSYLRRIDAEEIMVAGSLGNAYRSYPSSGRGGWCPGCGEHND